ncbi:MAG: GAF domain-containing protein [Caldilineales bacterium]|nr:GAF domain-containing protein [Caldilineales bacterium]
MITDAIELPRQDSLLASLSDLNRIGAAINRATSDPATGLADTLRLIAEGAAELLDHSHEVADGGHDHRVSVVLYAYNPQLNAFEPQQRMTSGIAVPDDSAHGDAPRGDGLGIRALKRRQRVISYEESDLEIHPHMRAAGALVGLCYPLVVADKMVGALYVYLHDERPFSRLDLLLLDNFVNQSAMAIHRVQQLGQIQRNLARKEEELSRLRRADLLISSRMRLDDTLETILFMALEVTDARYGILRLVDRAEQTLVTRAIVGDDLGRPAVESLPINATSITGWVAKHRQPLCIEDVRTGRWARLYYPLDHDLEMRAELAVPLIGAGGRLEGVINLESPQVGAFSEEDNLLLQSLATQAVIALQEVRLLDALQEIAEWFLTRPTAQVNAHLVELAVELLNAPLAALWTIDGDDLVLQAACGAHALSDRFPIDSSHAGRAIRDRRLFQTEEVHGDPLFAEPALSPPDGWTQAMIAPLLSEKDGAPVGALAVCNRQDHPGQFSGSDWDKKVLTILAHQAALAVRNAAHQEALRIAREQRSAAETFAAVGDIAANLLHRLNNKIGIIPVRVEGIQDKCAPALAADDYLAHNLAAIEQSAVEAMAEVRDSLFYLRPLELAPVDIDGVVAEAIAAAKLPSGIRVETSGLDDLPAVMAGQRRLALVFINLLENAATAMEGSGEIEISGGMHKGWVEIAVRDQGPGIAPTLHERIFEFNYSGAKRASGKLGFGLWWVKTLMARFGGAISVESDGQSGTTFWLRLPVEGPEP